MDPTEIVEQRIYIGNLPTDVKLSHLFAVLPDGYNRAKLEVRHNYDIDRNITSTYAFLNIEGTMADIKAWCDNAAEKSLAGKVLQIQFARLSFLERLRNEVNSQRRKRDTSSSNQLNSNVNSLKPRVDNFQSVKFGSDSSSSDDEEEMCVVKPGPAIEPAVRVVPASERGNDKELPSVKSSSVAEIKRLESLKERSTTHVNQQKIIRMAIKTMTKGPSNKIVFHDSDGENEEQAETQNEDDKKRKLFDDSESDNEDNISFSESKPRSKLIKTKVSAVDERFRMDSRFFDQNEDKDALCRENSDINENEQGKLLKIADSIIEKDPNVRPKIKNKIDTETAMPTRFNPLEKKHRSLIIKKDDEIESEEVVKKPGKVKPFKVEKGRFYEVSDNLKEQFKKTESTGFSLLGLFGGDDVMKSEESTNEDIKEKPAEDKSSKIKSLKNPLDTGVINFFNVDVQSDDEFEKPVSDLLNPENKITWNEPLFIPISDSRIEEALKFFNTPRKEPVPHAVLSRDLKIIVKKKYQRNVVKTQQFKTKLGSRRKFQNAKESDKKKKKLINM